MQDNSLQFEIQSILKIMHCHYPDVVNIDQLCTTLGKFSTKTAYKLLHANRITYFNIDSRPPTRKERSFLHRFKLQG